MGNRAVITTRDKNGLPVYNSTEEGLYVHWNGSDNSIRTFLKLCELGAKDAGKYDEMQIDRLEEMIGNFFGDGRSLHRGEVQELDVDNMDNGTYIIEDFKIIDREYFKIQPWTFDKCSYEEFLDNLKHVNGLQRDWLRVDESLLEQAAKDIVREIEDFRIEHDENFEKPSIRLYGNDVITEDTEILNALDEYQTIKVEALNILDIMKSDLKNLNAESLELFLSETIYYDLNQDDEKMVELIGNAIIKHLEQHPSDTEFEFSEWNVYGGEFNNEIAPSQLQSAPPLTAKTVMGSAPDNTEPSSEMEM